MNSFIRIVFMVIIILWTIMLTIHVHGQVQNTWPELKHGERDLLMPNVPWNDIDAPSTVQPPAKTCGPKWMGGCYVYGYGKTNMETLRDPYFLWPTVADGLAISLDAAVTSYGLSHSPCEEANGDLGPRPSNLRIAGVNALIFGANTGLRFLAIKVVPKDSKSKLAWIPRAFSIGSAVRSSVVHIRGARTWFTGGCL